MTRAASHLPLIVPRRLDSDEVELHFEGVIIILPEEGANPKARGAGGGESE